MFKRATWLGVGLVAGMGASKWAERAARRRLARYLPANQLRAGAAVAGRAREAASGGWVSIAQAVEEGKQAMAAKEGELRRKVHLPETSRPGTPRGPALLEAERRARR